MSKSKYGTPEYRIEQAIEELNKAKEEVLKIRKDIGSIEKINYINCNPNKTLSSFYTSYYGSFDETNKSQVESCHKAAVAEYKIKLDKIEKAHELNLSAIENNQKTRQAVVDFMKSVGIPDSYSHSYYKTSRSSKKTVEKKRAGYIEDIDRNILVNDGYEQAKKNLNFWLNRINESKEKCLKKIGEIELAEKKKIKEQESLKEFARFQIKYGENLLDWDEILDSILLKSKYLRLGHFLLKNREDWNDGYSYAECGLNGFHIENSLDQNIYDDINDHIENWDGDGRCFRDCEYNYDALFEMVEEQLYKDYKKVREKIND